MDKYSEMEEIQEIKKIYSRIKNDIIIRLKEFELKWLNSNDEEIFAELVFCILTPQSKAVVCWDAVKELIKKDLLFSNNIEEISKTINSVRFKNNKAKNIKLAKDLFFTKNKLPIKKVISDFNDNISAREWLVENVKGIAYKESSHFLRNIGFGREIAILDRHILRNLKLSGIIEEIPKSLPKKKYIEIEERTRTFAKEIGIDVAHLDFVLWYKETKNIFK